ncbi:hypothetical protein [Alloprevotella tannerae]|jgi:hypothetical protein
MDSNKKLEILESPAVQSHISMLQGVINKMSGNCANCKSWTVTLVAAMMILLVDKDTKIPNAWICLIPVGLFFFLDCYYLALERMCIAAQKKFLADIETGGYINSLYKIGGISGFWLRLYNTVKAIGSFSTIPFYLIVAIVVLFFGGIIGGQ